MKRIAFVPMLLATFAAACDPSAEPAEEQEGGAEALAPNTVAIDWIMPKRALGNSDLGCAAKLQPPTTFISPSQWEVQLDGCASTLTARTRFQWEVHFPNRAPILVDAGGLCRTSVNVPTLGEYLVKLTITVVGNATFSGERKIQVQDYLIASMGDSIASGEGNPDIPGEHLQRWDSKECRRSWNSGPGMAAVELENRDPHSSVTFVSTACSGDGMDEGLLRPKAGRLAQIQQIRNLVGSRPIDVLTVQIGANDAGFGDVVATCGHPQKNPCYDHSENGERFVDKTARKLAQLPGLYRELAGTIAGLRPGKVVMGEYPDPTGDQNGNFCEMNFADATGRLKDGVIGTVFGWVDGNISNWESWWAFNNVVLPLNGHVGTAARNNNWDLVTMAGAARGHGYCAAERWTTTWEETWSGQGDENGLLHPNRRGHREYANRMVEKIAPIMAATMNATGFVQPNSNDKIDRGSCIPSKPPVEKPAFCRDGTKAEQCANEQASCTESECVCRQRFNTCMQVCTGKVDRENCRMDP